jgi:O-antigen/teichoic acid export membrane protein
LLAPTDYGILASAVVLVGFLDLMTDLGLGPAIVQAKDLDRKDIGRAMGFTALIGLLAALLMTISAPLWATIYKDDRITPVVAAMSLAVVLTGFGAVSHGLLQRRLAFDVLAKAHLAQGLLTAAVTLSCAILLRSYWALVFGLLVGKLAFTLILLVASPVRPRFPLPSRGLKRLLSFGMVLTGDRFLYYLRANFDIALVGARLGQHALGLYSMALTLARLPADKIGVVFEPIAFPVLSHAQDKRAEFQRHYLALNVASATIVFPAAIGLALTADLAIPLILGRHWAPAVHPIQILCFAMPVLTLWSLKAPALNAIGRVKTNLWFSVVLAVVVPIAIWIGSHWGIGGVAAAGSGAFVIVAACGLGVTWSAIGLSARTYVAALRPALSSTIGMAAAVLLARLWIPDAWPPGASFLVATGAGALTYPLWMLAWHRGVTLAQLRAVKAAWSRAS